MASTKKTPIKLNEKGINSLFIGIMSLKEQIENKIQFYEKQSGKKFPFKFTDNKDDYDFINPNHYVQNDGRQTWEHMVEKFGTEKTAIFCELNAYKYNDRMGKKPGENIEREQGKVNWYQDKSVELYNKLDKRKIK